jgi:hypothetical protein
MGEMGNAYSILVGTRYGKRLLVRPSVDGRVILKIMLYRQIISV